MWVPIIIDPKELEIRLHTFTITYGSFPHDRFVKPWFE